MLKLPYSWWSNTSCNNFDFYNDLITKLFKNYREDNLLNIDELEEIEKYRENILNCKKN
jgi:hypothetical protein